MINYLDTLDKQLFLWLNGAHCPTMDTLMVFASGRLSWILLYIGIVFFFFSRRSWKVGLGAVVAVALTFALTDMVGNVIKHAVERPRPCIAFEGLIYSLEACSGAFRSFISNHAANIFGTATIAALLIRNKGWTGGLYGWAALVAYSRIYVGKHYPGDILCGAAFGVLAGYLVYRLYKCTCRLRKEVVFSILYYIYFIIVTPALFLAGFVLLGLTVLFDRDRKALHFYSYFWGLQYYWASPWWKIRVTGREHITAGKTYVIMSNHQSMLDICLLYKVPVIFKWVSKREVLRIPFVGWALWLHRDITITRGDRTGLMKMLNEAQAYIRRGVSIILFPEGTRAKDGEIHDFKEGGFLLAKRAGAAILPVVIDGNFAMQNGWKLKPRQVFRMHILPEIHETEVAAHSSKETMKNLQEQMREALFEMRTKREKQ
ncbi:MAG: phosphatase PAP2 family protein [Prevotellaceae bacterium]|jgi:1-acyl-sn-glycerol-3-phosphate acyltransferase|nr:phosphatase PAP2 family protein [Prevotellaceae bacterium]